MALVWENLCCDDDGPFCAKLLQECTDEKNQQILTDLNGYLQFGELTALMGPSGSGQYTNFSSSKNNIWIDTFLSI